MKTIFSLLLIFGFLFASPQAVRPQETYAALESEAEKALANAFVPQGQPFALAIKKVQEKKLFRFYEVAKNYTLSQSFDRFYTPSAPISASAPPDEILKAAQNLSKLGYSVEADKYFEIYIQKAPKSGSYVIAERARNAMLGENYRVCVDAMKKAFKINDSDTKFWANSYNYTMAICSAQLGDDKTARASFASLNAHLKNSFPYRLFQDGAYKCTGTADDNYATAAYNQLKGNTYEAYRDAFIAVKCDPNHLASLEILFNIENAADGKTDTLNNWASHRKLKIMRLQEKPVPSPFGMSADERNEFFRYFVAVGEEAFKKGDYEWALIYGNEAVVGFPENAEGYILRARALYSQTAVANLRLAAWLDASKALQIDPKNGLAYNLRGLVLLNLKNDESAAMLEFTKGISVSPGEFRLFANRGMVYSKRKNFQAAYADFDRATELNSGDFNSFLNKSIAALELKDFRNAAAALERTLELNGKREWKNLDQSVEIADAGRSIRRNLVIAYDALGMITAADVHHQYLLENYFDHADTKSLSARNPELVASYARIESAKKRNEELRNENNQRGAAEKFWALAEEETESAASFNQAVKRKTEYAKAIDLGSTTFIGELILLYNARITAVTDRINKMEPFIQNNQLAPSVRPTAQRALDGIKAALKKYEADRAELQRKLRELRR